MPADDSAGSDPPTENTEVQALEKKLDLALAVTPHSSVLVLMNGPNSGRFYPLDRPETSIGRGSDADIHVADKAASQHHAKILNSAGHYRLIDLNSTNGTFVNNQLVGEHVLRHGDSVWIGETAFAFLQEGGAELGQTMTLAGRGAGGRIRVHSAGLDVAAAPMVGHAEEEASLSLADLIHKLLIAYQFVKRHRQLLLGVTMLGLMVGGVSVRLAPPPQSAMCEVRLLPDAKENPVESGWRAPNQARTAFFEAAGRHFSSVDLIVKTLKDLEEEDASEGHAAAIQSRLVLEDMQGGTYSGRYEQAYFQREGHTALEFLDKHIHNYIETDVEKTLKVFKAEATFLAQQLEENAAELKNIEKQLLDFKNQNIGQLPDQAGGANSTRFDLMMRKVELSGRLSRLRLELAAAKQQTKEEGSLLRSTVTATQPYQDRLTDIERRLSEARARGLGDQHPEVQSLRRESRELKALISRQVKSGSTELQKRTDVAYQGAKARTRDLQVAVQATAKELGTVADSLSKLDDVVSKMPEVEARLEELTRAKMAAEAYHARLYEQHKKAMIQVELEREYAHARYEIISIFDTTPSGLSIWIKRLGICGVAGLFLALLVAGLKELIPYARKVVAQST